METEIFHYTRKTSLCGRIKYPKYDALEIFLFKTSIYKKLVDIYQTSPEKITGIQLILRCLPDRFSRLVENWRDVPSYIIFNIHIASDKIFASYDVISTLGSFNAKYPSLFPHNFSIREYKNIYTNPKFPNTHTINLT